MVTTVFGEQDNINPNPESNLNFLFAGFSVVWVGIIGYIFYLVSKQKALKAELEDLKNQIKNNDTSSKSRQI
tara:strand:+ start:2008 stop:2223 length:216 start_codon:yes stop_codon:yes gene_type:complete